MGEWKQGKLKSSSGDPVKYPSGRKQALAISFSESGQSNKEKGGEVVDKKLSRSQKSYNKDVDAYNWYVVNKITKHVETGYENKQDAVDQRKDMRFPDVYAVMSKRELQKQGIENPNEKWKALGHGGQTDANEKEAKHLLRYGSASADTAKEYVSTLNGNEEYKQKATKEIDEAKSRINQAIETLDNNNEMAHGGEIQNIKEEINILKESIQSKATDEFSRTAMKNRVEDLEELLHEVSEKEKAQRNVTIPANSFWVAIDQKYANPMRNHLNTNNIKFTSRMVNRKYTVYVDSQEDLVKVVSIYNLKRVKGKDKPVSVSEVSGKSEKGGKLWEGNANKKEQVLRNKANRMGLGSSLSEDTLKKIENKGPNWKKRVEVVRTKKRFES